MRPIIGITSNHNDGENIFSLKEFYISSISEAGGVPLILPPTTEEKLIEDYLQLCNGLLLTGGGDIDPLYWGAFPGDKLGEINPLRDSFEIIISKKALQERKPVLGICRGCQVMNVAAGGSLFQDIVSDMCHMQNIARKYPFHDIFVEKNTRLGEILKSDIIKVNSLHHQAIERPGAGIRISALAADGTVEAIESRRHKFYIGVQWHPESLSDEFSSRLFTALTLISKHS